MFLKEYARGERLGRVVVEHGDGALCDDGAAVERLVNEVDGAAAYLDAVFDGLALRVEAREGWQQARMDVQYATAKNFYELRREQAHETGQTDEFYFTGLQDGDDLALMFGARASRAFDGERFDTAPGGVLQALRVGVVAHDERDTRAGHTPALDGFRERNHVRPTTGNEDGKFQDMSFRFQAGDSGFRFQNRNLKFFDLKPETF